MLRLSRPPAVSFGVLEGKPDSVPGQNATGVEEGGCKNSIKDAG